MLFGRKKKNPIKIVDKKVVDWKYTTCGYCSTGCSIQVGLNAEGEAVSSQGVAGADVNRGKLCVKGIFEHELFKSSGRGDMPLVREQIFEGYAETDWDSALDKMGSEIQRIQQTYGRDSFAIISTGQLLTEEFYTLGKLARGVIGTNNYDGNTTLCMASAVSGYKRSFGSDGPPGCYEDFEHTECLIAWGSNLPEQHPIIYWRMQEAMEKRKFPLIVVDPRVTMLAQKADMHLAIKPGTDLVLLNALCHVILEEGLEDKSYIEAHTNGYEQFEKLVSEYDPTTAAGITGIDEDTIRNVARLYAKADAAMSIWTMGINQSTHGSDGVVAINNLNLVTGNIGKDGGTSLSITGQCNAMGTREWSSCSGLPGYRALENPEHREEIADYWGIDPEFFPKKRGLTETDIFPAIETGQIKGLWLVATNPMTSMPNTARIRKTLEKLDFLVVQDSYADVETTQYAHMYLPAATWAEKEGVFTNTERRVNIVRQVIKPKGNSKSDLWIFNHVAKRFAQAERVKFPDEPEQVFNEMKHLSKGRLVDISGMSHDLIEEQRGIQWPFPESKLAGSEPDNVTEKGDQRLYSDGKFSYADGKAKLIPLPFIDKNEKPQNDYPFWLNTGRVVEHFHSRTKTGKIGNNNKYSPMPYMEMNPDAAHELGVVHGDYVRCVSKRGDAVVMAQLTQRVPYDMVFVPFHFHDCVNRLTLGLLDPHSRQPAFKQSAVRVETIEDQQAASETCMESREF
ncbi:molybdopterin oxidoreductase family protein [sulfur-oxidizing endosymbiont of Gigantopelta aegis]|uniref:molybdopterin oxidoreductase family protein n=1 Tax=sulfur-oxidizing endosymbiont of Gigantopelta aegis TaxID=2794934 RepID=UPI0018DD108D|nr:nitrate reductase [sulfur-oxidizing endosymbiont of Gigantopelta aegis]